MKYSALSKKNADELSKLESELVIELMKHKANAATGAPGKDSGKIRAIKRDIARIKTVLRSKGGVPKQ